MSQAGLPVPAWFCVPAHAFREAISHFWSALQPLLLDPETPTEKIQALLQTLELPAELATELQQKCTELKGEFFAVRSSATGEDQSDHAFAGLFRTWLQIPPDQVAEHVLECWREAFSPPVLTYLRQYKLDLNLLDMAVIVQVQIAAEASGILFQASPDGNLNDQVIVAGYGLGEGVVSGLVESDTYRCDRFSGIWQEKLVIKTRQVMAVSQGPEIREVPLEWQKQPVLNQAQLQDLLELSARVSKISEGFQDIEWCRQGQNWYLLQSRPITTLPPGPYGLFDSSNIQESYPGIVLPLTASLVQRGYGTNFTVTLRKLGFPQDFLRQRQEILTHMTAQIEGRIYYHMQHWTTVLQWIPGARRLILQSFADMISRNREPDTAMAQLPFWQDLWLGIRLYPILLLRMLTLPLAMKRYRQSFQALYPAFINLDIETPSAESLIQSYDTYFAQFLPLSSVPLLNDLWTGLVMGRLRRLLQQRLGETAESLLHDLMADLPGLESTMPLQSLEAMAKQWQQTPALKPLLTEQTPEHAWQSLQSSDFAVFYSQVQGWLQAYGGRSMQELKLEEPSFHEAPWELLRLIQIMATDPSPSHRGPQRRQAAEARLRQLWPLITPSGLLCRCLLRASRQALLRREIGRMDRTRLMAGTRRIFRAVGKQLAASGWLQSADDIYFLDQQELLAWAQSQNQAHGQVTSDFDERIQQRRESFAAYSQRSPRERILLPLPEGPWQIPQTPRPALDPNQQGLQGIGCAGGSVTGEVVVVTQPRPDLDVSGKILICVSTDPGWIYLMARASGLVTEQGNLLSHAAILARELGLPTVVGVPGATQLLQTGERIHIDGSTGLIERLENQIQNPFFDQN